MHSKIRELICTNPVVAASYNLSLHEPVDFLETAVVMLAEQNQKLMEALIETHLHRPRDSVIVRPQA